MDRRAFLVRTGSVIAAALANPLGARPAAAQEAASADLGSWDAVRRQFSLSPDYIHMSALLVASHPKPVQAAIDAHRRRLNEMPVSHLEAENRRLQWRARQAAAAYLGAEPGEIALTDSTTMGLGLIYGGLRLGPGDEILTSTHDYYATHEALRLAAAQSGATVKKAELYRPGEALGIDPFVQRVEAAIGPRTRVVALTWVHSGSGLKLPISSIGAAIERINGQRQASERILFCVDGVHGFGVEDVRVADLRCDFFIAGCHKWLFGPRGTGIVWGRPAAWREVRPTIPSFIDPEAWSAWATGGTPGPTTATMMTPGGFKPFEHLWAIAEAFAFHQAIGKTRIQGRTRELAKRLKVGLSEIPGVSLVTPIDDHLSAGIVSFDVAGMSPQQVVARLEQRRIIATTTPYATPHARLTPSIRNTPEEIDAVLDALRTLT